MIDKKLIEKMLFKTYKGETLENVEASYKIDGVRAHTIDGKVYSRANKPLYNVPPIYPICEVFLGSWEDTVSACRTHNSILISEDFLYCLNPIDSRLFIGTFSTLTKEMVEVLKQEALSKGFEGLVLKSNGLLYKVKNKETIDILVTDIIPGKGRLAGKVGSLVTSMGNVGTGLTDEQRTLDFIGKIIEVEVMELTPKGKFRHPRFIRVREDK